MHAFADCLGRNYANVRSMGRLPPAVRSLLIANAIIFVIGMLMPEWGRRMIQWFAFWFPRNEHFAVWQFVTYMFMHGSLTHIFFNMFALASFGLPLELQWGTRRFLMFYFLCGIGAGLVHAAVSWGEFSSYQHRLITAGMSEAAVERILATGTYPGARTRELGETVVSMYRLYATPMVGASGAIYGVLVAFGLLFPNARLALLFLPVPIAAKYFIPVIVGLDLFSGVTGFSLFGGGIAHFAHLGGALIGFLLMWYWRTRTRRAAELRGFR